MVLSEAIRDYSEYARHELGHTISTYYSYVSWQRNFARWLAENGNPDPRVQETSPQVLRRYSYSLSGRNLRPRTIRGALHALRAMFGYLVLMKVIAEDPTAEIKLPKKDAATRLLVTDDDLLRLMQATERQQSDFRCVRDRAILAVLVYCGLRRRELLDLTTSAVSLADGSLLVQQGKGNKSRTVYLHEEVSAALRDWLALRQGLKCRHDALFLAESRRPLGERGFAQMLEEIKAIAGLKSDPRVKPHSIRHAAATRLLRNGADIRSIQTWLGHAHLQTTAIYLHADEEQARKIAPLAGLRTSSAEPVLESAEQKQAGARRSFFQQRRRKPTS